MKPHDESLTKAALLARPFPKMRNYRFDLESVLLSPRALASYDVVLLATNHDAFDYQQIREHSKLVVDTRGVYQQPAQNVVKA